MVIAIAVHVDAFFLSDNKPRHLKQLVLIHTFFFNQCAVYSIIDVKS